MQTIAESLTLRGFVLIREAANSFGMPIGERLKKSAIAYRALARACALQGDNGKAMTYQRIAWQFACNASVYGG